MCACGYMKVVQESIVGFSLKLQFTQKQHVHLWHMVLWWGLAVMGLTLFAIVFFIMPTD
jgi:uncharacterized membrane protein YjfL (UPF0719 family)